ncbi:FAD-linked sulfhydryl oxidase ALR [Clonorchis sinensis]|uniref:FAD-linked sulfhydryl oxidase ALR n=2 Tax=Clonorchis sinensis TaxID=79923 RepID=A0A8T1N269_CLOSI|nr:FAD-linked sulfhydryl oxidase ALR [Clonorchis sinensis]GAA55264.1 FAD-linked sulfhydryl oxidase ALR [Clonorchis sinensis]
MEGRYHSAVNKTNPTHFSMSSRHSERFSVADDDDDIFNPKSKAFCQACVDVSAFASLQSDPKWFEKREKLGCPLDKLSLGRATWSLLHTMAAYYPEKPTAQQQKEMAGFIKGLSTFYPCLPCAIDFRKNLVLNPPELGSRQELSGWLCLQHNLVNKKCHKPLFDCSRVLERWRYGWADGSCDLPGMD